MKRCHKAILKSSEMINKNLRLPPCSSSTTRRNVIRLSGFAAAGALLAPFILRSEVHRSRKRVLIVGGGISGLAAAQRLRVGGLTPIIIEARQRLGGRVWTDANGFDLGASWIHGKSGNPLMRLVKDSKATTFAFDYDNHWRYDAHGELTDDADRMIDRNYAALEQKIASSQRGASPSTPVQFVVDEFSATLPKSSRVGLRYAVNSSISHEYAADPTELSLKYFDDGEEQHGGDLFLSGGYATLLSALRGDEEIHLGHIVQEMDWSKDAITLRTNRGTFTASAAIITLPLGVLKSGTIQFTPALPNSHRQGIARLGFGTLDKLFVRFPKVAWPSEPHLFGFVGDGLLEEWVNLAAITGQPVLVGFNAGSLAERLEGKSDEEIGASAHQILRKMFGSALPAPTQIVASRWRQDPFALGAYSSYAPGSSPKDRIALADPITNNFLLAGEACSIGHPATVHGALRSGQDAADFILKNAS